MSELLPCPFCGGEAHLGLYYRGRYAASCCICGSRFGALMPTKAEAIEVWNTRTLGGGKLTAEQVRETVEKHWHDLPAEYGMPEASALPEYSYDWQAIADELNATLGGGECKNANTDGYSFRFECSECSHSVIVHDCSARLDELPRFCPNCGKRIRKAVER